MTLPIIIYHFYIAKNIFLGFIGRAYIICSSLFFFEIFPFF